MSGEGWPSGTVTFLFTDIEASTRRWREDESVMADALRAHDAVLGAAIESHGGVAFKHTGDGAVAVFDSAVAAVAAAVAAQSDLGLPVRMGLHTGESELRDGDYFGTTLNRTARVMDAGNGGQVLVSEATAALLVDVELVDLGDYVLKGFDDTERIFQVGVGSFPALRARQAIVGNLPREMTRFVGRTGDLDELVATVSAHQLVTLFGVGGTGKTRLALEVARSMAGEFDRGGWLVELGQITVPEAVPLALVNGVGVLASPGGDVVEDLIERLRDEQMLVVVDNCEHHVG